MTETSPLYIPTLCKPMSATKRIPQIRLLEQGYPGSGKTWAALTFPNPVVVNLDRGLGAHIGREDVIEVPLYDPQFVRQWSKSLSYTTNDLKDMIVKWLDDEAVKLTEEQTLVFDGCTGMQNAYHNWFNVNKSSFLTRNGEFDGFAEWRVKRQFFGEVMEKFKTLKCHVVFIVHETDQKDKTSPGLPASYSGKIRPLLSGSFSDELGSHFTDVFRCQTTEVPTDFAPLKDADLMRNWGMTKQQFKAYCDSSTNGSIYYFQTVSDSVFDAKSSSVMNVPRYIPAHFDSFKKYRRQMISATKQETLSTVTAQQP